MEEAVDAALADLPDDSVIKPFLIRNRSEVKLMCITEYNEERTLAQTREEGRMEGLKEGHVEGLKEGRVEGLKEGRVEGLKEGRVEGIEMGKLYLLAELVRDGILSSSEAAERAHLTVEEFERKAASCAV